MTCEVMAKTEELEASQSAHREAERKVQELFAFGAKTSRIHRRERERGHGTDERRNEEEVMTHALMFWEEGSGRPLTDG